ncbi:hypothetical protein C1645_817640 [Glomus cerebriforme]|uniref:Uncharacterized protein n=1 Tax=Glomus cerebriforme TaxID=658196 RepID=A0A397TIQ2_9GLOM|nr:hypothetical protein C1645_817640 [Glomus cerebriforme]
MSAQLPFFFARNPIWTPTEESRLIVAVSRFGIRNWHSISREVSTRSPMECRNRWRRIIYIAYMLLQINHNVSSSASMPSNYRPRMARRPRAANYRFLRNSIRNTTSNNVPSRRDIRMTLDYILN